MSSQVKLSRVTPARTLLALWHHSDTDSTVPIFHPPLNWLLVKVFSILFGAKSFKLKSETLTLPHPLKSIESNQTVAASISRLLMVVSLAQFMVGGKSEVLMDTFIGGKLSSTSSSSSYRPSPTVPVPQSFSCSYGGLHARHNISNIKKNSVRRYNLGA